MILFPDIAFIVEEATGCINEGVYETVIGTIKAPRNPPSCFHAFFVLIK